MQTISLFIKYVFSLIVSFLALNSFAQEFNVTHYTTKQKLASNIVYTISEDSIGRLYLSTENGLCVFDGTNFETFNTTNGLSENTVISSKPISNNQLVFSNVTKGVFYKNEKHISKLEDITTPYFNNITLLKNKLLFSCFIAKGRFYIYNTNIKKPPTFFKKIYLNDSTDEIKHIESINDSTLIISCNIGLYSFILSESNYKLTLILKNEKINYTYFHNDKIYIYLNNKIIIYDSKTHSILDSIIVPNLFGTIKFGILYKNNIWLSTRDPNFLITYNLETKKFSNIGQNVNIENSYINSFFIDSENNLWLATHGRGLIKISDLNNKMFYNRSNVVNPYIISLHTTASNQLFAGSYTCFYNIKNDSTYIAQYKGLTNQDFYHYGFIERKNNIISFINKNVDYKPISIQTQNIKYLCGRTGSFISDSIIIVGTWDMKLRYFKLNSNLSLTSYDSLYIDDEISRINKIKIINKNQALIATDIGLYIADFKSKKILYNDSVLKKSKVNDICVIGKNYFAATDKGLYFKSPSKKIFFNKIGNQPLGSVNSLYYNCYLKQLYIGTNLGLFVITNTKIYFLNEVNGVTHNEINAITFKDNHVLLAHYNGYEKVNATNFIKNFRIPITYSKIIFNNDSNDVYIFGNRTINIKEINKQITIKFSGIQYNSSNLYYRYSVNSSNSYYLEKGEINLAEIAYGKTLINLQTSTDQINWSKPLCLTLIKEKPFFIEQWFLVIAFLIILFISFVFFNWRLTVIKRKNAKRELLLTELNTLKLRLVNSSTNAHFLSNVLVGIQQFILQGNTDLASDYLALFSRHMRHVLASFQKEHHTLKQEIELMQEFIALEKLRYQSSIEFVFSNTLALKQQEVLIPPLLLQPIIENAIEHAFIKSNRSQQNSITIDLFQNAMHQIEIVIEDNGCGFDFNNQKSETSFGLKVTKDRANLQSNISVTFTNLIEIDSSKTGTRIQFLIDII